MVQSKFERPVVFHCTLYYQGRMMCSRKRNCSALNRTTCPSIKFFFFFFGGGGVSLEELSSLGQIAGSGD